MLSETLPVEVESVMGMSLPEGIVLWAERSA